MACAALRSRFAKTCPRLGELSRRERQLPEVHLEPGAPAQLGGRQRHGRLEHAVDVDGARGAPSGMRVKSFSSPTIVRDVRRGLRHLARHLAEPLVRAPASRLLRLVDRERFICPRREADERDGVVDLVGDARRERAERRETVGLHELLARSISVVMS